MPSFKNLALCVTLVGLAGWPGDPSAQAAPPNEGLNQAMAVLKNRESARIGTLQLTQGPNGALAQVRLEGLPHGWHAIHFHEHGDCSAADFTSAGGHAVVQHPAYDLGENHGFMMGSTQHVGDMPNVWVSQNQEARVDYFLSGVTIGALLDGSGAAVVVHDQADDYTSQPSGDAGPRIACGVLR